MRAFSCTRNQYRFGGLGIHGDILWHQMPLEVPVALQMLRTDKSLGSDETANNLPRGVLAVALTKLSAETDPAASLLPDRLPNGVLDDVAGETGINFRGTNLMLLSATDRAPP